MSRFSQIRSIQIVVLLSLLTGLAFPYARLAQSQDPTAKLVSSLLGPTPLLEDLRELCDRIGGRPTGSPACERAIGWASASFTSTAVDNVTLEAFTVPALWLPRTAEANCISPETFSLRLAAAPYSTSTPAGHPLIARLVDAGDGSALAFAKLGASARLANSASVPARRQSRTEVDKLLRDTKLDEQMKAFGQWDDWVSGRRGVSSNRIKKC